MQKLASCSEQNQVTPTPMHHTIKVYQGDIYKVPHTLQLHEILVSSFMLWLF